ncbi:MAG TPA: plasmid pRiA4b ORF-3 family protein [Desulfitobacteriaceae bacterium]|nr:plasmid pRiA4b ORF-3 family protein [Desulfitobacteriaceae bacterium]
MLIQCTKKLLDELGKKPVADFAEQPLFSWHANILRLNHRKTVVLVNDSNRYVVVLYGLKKKDCANIDEIMPGAIRETLLREGIKTKIVEDFMQHSPQIVYARTKDRSLVARMNKACANAAFFGGELDSSTLWQSIVSMKTSACMVSDGKNDYFHPDELMYKELEAFAREPIFGCKAVQLKVTLDLAKHDVWRRIIVPYDITFKKLHEIFQIAFDWKEQHLHEFNIYDKDQPLVNLVSSEEALEYPSDTEMLIDKEVKLSAYIPRYTRLEYIYDLGDYWQHNIEVEKMIEDYPRNYPVCLAWEGNVPPEDVGGDGGYEDFLEAYFDPEHEEHEDMVRWAEMQWYRKFDLDLANRRLERVLRRRDSCQTAE